MTHALYSKSSEVINYLYMCEKQFRARFMKQGKLAGVESSALDLYTDDVQIKPL